MREILFRGKRVDNSAWVEGAFCMKDCDNPFSEMLDRPSIIKYDPPCDGFWFRVNEETVGQYTGMNDKTGKKIFEGDILEERIRGRPLKDGTPGYKTRKYIVCCGGWSFYLEAIGASGRPSRCVSRCKIIGNIHDNPELLEKGGT